jgi:phage shock protein C
VTEGRAPRRLYRSRRERMFAGICGGFAEYLNADPTTVRVIYVVVSILSVAVPGLLLYLILYFVIPLAPE